MSETIQSITKGLKSTQFLQPNFWFRNPGAASLDEAIFILTLFVIIFLLGVLILIYNRWQVGIYPPKNKILKPGGIGLISFGSTGLVFSLFRWQGIDFLGVRFILLAVFLASLAWTVFFLFLYLKKVPEQAVEYETRLIKKKYLSK